MQVLSLIVRKARLDKRDHGRKGQPADLRATREKDQEVADQREVKMFKWVGVLLVICIIVGCYCIAWTGFLMLSKQGGVNWGYGGLKYCVQLGALYYTNKRSGPKS
jgi:hypothetical protein